MIACFPWHPALSWRILLLTLLSLSFIAYTILEILTNKETSWTFINGDIFRELMEDNSSPNCGQPRINLDYIWGMLEEIAARQQMLILYFAKEHWSWSAGEDGCSDRRWPRVVSVIVDDGWWCSDTSWLMMVYNVWSGD